MCTKRGLFTGVKERMRLPSIDDTTQLSEYSIAERMSWAAHRFTTRPEDEAYCLLGVFDINMPLIYGEGRKAFHRLQQEIIQNSNDLSVLFFENERETPSRLLATKPRQFRPKATMRREQSPFNEFSLTNRGLQIVEPRLFFTRPP